MDKTLVLTILFVTLPCMFMNTYAQNMINDAELTSNITVVTLDTPISREGCGSTQLCAAEASECDPSAGNCLFLAVRQQSGSNFNFSLSGQSDGYIAATLSPDGTMGNNDTTYVCANNNGSVRFFTTFPNNVQLNETTTLNVTSVKGRVNGTTMQCTFAATVPDATSRTTNFTLTISTGSFNSTSGTLGPPKTRFKSSGVNLTNTNANLTNEVSNTTNTTMPTTVGNMTSTTEETPNITVVTLDTPISREGCGSTQLCAAEPSECDPSAGNCLFLAVRQQSGSNFNFSLSGQSDGYIAATLSPDGTMGNNDTTYVCANNNGSVRFFTTFPNNVQLNETTTLNVTSVKGRVNGTTMQCTFAATVPDATSRTTNFTLTISTGSFNSTSGTLGPPEIQFKSSGVNLTNTNANLTNEVSNTTNTTMPTTVGNMTSTTEETPNITVVTLDTPISREGCGSTQLCAAEPSECDPSAENCLFLAARQQSGSNFNFSLSGQSGGYIAATLSPDGTMGNNDTTYVCANNNGSVRFFTTFLNNLQLNETTTLNVTSVKGRVNGTTIQCTFAATVPDATSRTTNFTLAISTGSFNSTSGTLGPPEIQFKSSGVNLTNTNANLTNEVSNTTTTTMPTTVGNMTSTTEETPNITVVTLDTPISREGCGSTQLCAAEPSECDPSAGNCFFLAARQQSGSNFNFSLSGQSGGYIAATLSPDGILGNNDTTYVCANNNGSVRFFTTFLNNLQLNETTTLNVTSVKGRVNGTTIQCTFAATVPDATSRTTNFTLAISTGSFNSTSGTLGPPEIQFKSSGVNLTNTNANLTNEVSTNTTNTTTIAPTTSHAITFQQSLTQALLISVGMLGLAML